MPLSLYLHIPFCSVRCAYCDFNTYAGLDDLVRPYAEALRAEIGTVGQAAGGEAEVHTIYFGGGTPSLLPPEVAAGLLSSIYRAFRVRPNCEITFEANPESASQAWMSAIRGAGANRLSVGVQSAQPHELRFLDRRHSFEEAACVVHRARRAGFDSVNLDLIYGLPDQCLEDWIDSVHRSLSLEPDHLSLYSLTLEHGTPLRARFEAGLFPAPDPDLAADMYESAADALGAAGYRQYEISNWARDGGRAGAQADEGLPAHACLHNVQYWRNLPYLGLGAGAHGSARGWRYSNVLSPRAYVERMREAAQVEPPCSPAVAERRAIDRDTEMDETLMMGLRLTDEGIVFDRFRERFGEFPSRRHGRQLDDLASAGLLMQDRFGLRLTPRGRLLGNRVFEVFV